MSDKEVLIKYQIAREYSYEVSQDIKIYLNNAYYFFKYIDVLKRNINSLRYFVTNENILASKRHYSFIFILIRGLRTIPEK
jgi:hypothetical protein